MFHRPLKSAKHQPPRQLEALEHRHMLDGTVLINEIYIDPPSGGDVLYEYLELRGPANLSLDGYYFIAIENENNAGNTGATGTLDMVYNLSGKSLGSNGFLVVTRDGHPFSIDPQSNEYHFDGPLLENSGATYMVIKNVDGVAPAQGGRPGRRQRRARRAHRQGGLGNLRLDRCFQRSGRGSVRAVVRQDQLRPRGYGQRPARRDLPGHQLRNRIRRPVGRLHGLVLGRLERLEPDIRSALRLHRYRRLPPVGRSAGRADRDRIEPRAAGSLRHEHDQHPGRDELSGHHHAAQRCQRGGPVSCSTTSRSSTGTTLRLPPATTTRLPRTRWLTCRAPERPRSATSRATPVA